MSETTQPLTKRKVYKYVKTETTMEEIKAGELFSQDPASEADRINVEGRLYLATEDAKPNPEQGPDFYQVVGIELIQRQHVKGDS